MENKPELTIDSHGNKYWYLNGKRHRMDGPAVELKGGYKAWYLNGELHREDGPAIERPNGVRKWYLNDNFICWESLRDNDNYIVVERGIPTGKMFGELKITEAKLLTAKGTVFAYDNLPGFILED